LAGNLLLVPPAHPYLTCLLLEAMPEAQTWTASDWKLHLLLICHWNGVPLGLGGYHN
jgi:hypothetical protein